VLWQASHLNSVANHPRAEQFRDLNPQATTRCRIIQTSARLQMRARHQHVHAVKVTSGKAPPLPNSGLSLGNYVDARNRDALCITAITSMPMMSYSCTCCAAGETFRTMTA